MRLPCACTWTHANKTKPADVGRYGLHLQLKNVANGKHTYKIVIRDYAGNEREVTRSFTVAVPIATPTPTFRPIPTVDPDHHLPAAHVSSQHHHADALDHALPHAHDERVAVLRQPDAHDERVADRRRAHQLAVAGRRCGRLGRRWR